MSVFIDTESMKKSGGGGSSDPTFGKATIRAYSPNHAGQTVTVGLNIGINSTKLLTLGTFTLSSTPNSDGVYSCDITVPSTGEYVLQLDGSKSISRVYVHTLENTVYSVRVRETLYGMLGRTANATSANPYVDIKACNLTTSGKANVSGDPKTGYEVNALTAIAAAPAAILNFGSFTGIATSYSYGSYERVLGLQLPTVHNTYISCVAITPKQALTEAPKALGFSMTFTQGRGPVSFTNFSNDPLSHREVPKYVQRFDQNDYMGWDLYAAAVLGIDDDGNAHSIGTLQNIVPSSVHTIVSATSLGGSDTWKLALVTNFVIDLDDTTVYPWYILALPTSASNRYYAMPNVSNLQFYGSTPTKINLTGVESSAAGSAAYASYGAGRPNYVGLITRPDNDNAQAVAANKKAFLCTTFTNRCEVTDIKYKLQEGAFQVRTYNNFDNISELWYKGAANTTVPSAVVPLITEYSNDEEALVTADLEGVLALPNTKISEHIALHITNPSAVSYLYMAYQGYQYLDA